MLPLRVGDVSHGLLDLLILCWLLLLDLLGKELALEPPPMLDLPPIVARHVDATRPLVALKCNSSVDNHVATRPHTPTTY